MKTKEEMREYMKRWYKNHKEEHIERCKKYYETHKKECREKNNQYYKVHKEKKTEYNMKFYASHKEKIKIRREKYEKYFRYFRKNFSRFISLKNYITIMKLGDNSLKLSIMIKLGKGTIDQDEAVMLSGMTFTKDDLNEMNEWFYVCKHKSSFS